MKEKKESKCIMCKKTLVGNPKLPICAACKKKASDVGVNTLGGIALVGGVIFTGIKYFTKDD